MIELINTAVQTVDIGQSVVYNTAAVRCFHPADIW